MDYTDQGFTYTHQMCTFYTCMRTSLTPCTKNPTQAGDKVMNFKGKPKDSQKNKLSNEPRNVKIE